MSQPGELFRLSGRTSSGSGPGFARLTAAAAIVGGALWIAFAVLVAARPAGCIGDECLARPMRNSGDLGFILLAAVVLIATGFSELARRALALNRASRLWRRAGILALLGAVMLFAGRASDSISPEIPPYLVVPGIIVLTLGLFLIAFAVLRARILPRWISVLLIVAVLALVAVNDQNARILFIVPFGAAWLAIGFFLWRTRRAAL